jgi:hypothetical protein
MEMNIMNKDTLVVSLFDMHTGSTVALCPDRFMQFAKQGNNHTPNSKQVEINKHFEKCAGEVLKARQDKRLLIVNGGDAIEGWHHNASELIPCNEKEQAELHIELMGQFKRWVDYDGRRGDKLFYTKGTETHTKDWEDYVAEKLSAQENGDLYIFDDLKLEINGKRLWWTHHGPAPGKGHNKGNGLRNWIKTQFFEAVQENIKPPHMIITGHVHNPYWDTYTGRYEGAYFPVRGLISPSWQLKTRYANGKAPLVKNKVGLQYFTITADGQIGDPVELIMK